MGIVRPQFRCDWMGHPLSLSEGRRLLVVPIHPEERCRTAADLQMGLQLGANCSD